MRALRVSGQGALQVGDAFELASEATVGRSPSCDLRLDDRTISRTHARFAVRHEQWWVENLTANNALFLNGQEVAPGSSAPLPGEPHHIQLGGALFLSWVALETQPVHEVIALDAPSPRAACLEVTRDGDVATVCCHGKLVKMRPSSALVLYALGVQAGQVVHRWDLLDAIGREVDLAQAVSGLRRALRRLIEAGDWARSEVEALIEQASTGDQASLGDLGHAALLRHLVVSRRGHGYALQAPRWSIVVREAG